MLMLSFADSFQNELFQKTKFRNTICMQILLSVARTSFLFGEQVDQCLHKFEFH